MQRTLVVVWMVGVAGCKAPAAIGDAAIDPDIGSAEADGAQVDAVADGLVDTVDPYMDAPEPDAGGPTFCPNVGFPGLPLVDTSSPVGIVLGDVDADGNLDAVISNANMRPCSVCPQIAQLSIYRGLGNGQFGAPVIFALQELPTDAVLGDIDGNGSLDIVATARDVVILRNRGDGTFDPPTVLTTDFNADYLTVTDLNGDSRPDIIVETFGKVATLLNAGNGSFSVTMYAAGSTPTQMLVRDLNADGRPEIVVTNEFPSCLCSGSEVSVLRNTGDGTFAPRVVHIVGLAPSSIVDRDLNGDGKVDLAVVNRGSDTVSILINTGSSFASQVTYPVGIGPLRIAASDLNGDGTIDLVVGNAGRYNTQVEGTTASILSNRGDGTFLPQVVHEVGLHPRGIQIVDVSSDGKPDLVVQSNTVGVSINNGTTFSPHVEYAFPSNIALGDLNGDGRLDAAAATRDAFGVMLQTGGGAFAAAISYRSAAARHIVADLSNDGRPDVAVAGYGRVNVLMGTSTGLAAPTPYQVGASPFVIAAKDLNADGARDLVVTSRTDADYTVDVLLNTGNGSFATHVTYLAGESPIQVVLRDLDADARPDIVVAHESPSGIGFLRNRGDGTFHPMSTLLASPTESVLATAWGDLDGNGTIDLAVSTRTSSNGMSSLKLYSNSGMTFTHVATQNVGGSLRIEIGDLDGDGRQDLVVPYFVLRNNGNWSFTASQYSLGPAATTTRDIALGDLDGDRKLDVAVIDDALNILINMGNGTFGMPRRFVGGPFFPISLSMADMDGDLAKDLVVGSLAYVSIVKRNAMIPCVGCHCAPRA